MMNKKPYSKTNTVTVYIAKLSRGKTIAFRLENGNSQKTFAAAYLQTYIAN